MIQRSPFTRVQSVQNQSKLQFPDEEGEEEHHQSEQFVKGSRTAKKEEMFSLTLLNAEKGDINLPQQLPKTMPPKQSTSSTKSLMSWFKRKEAPKPKQPVSELLPCPKVVKISDALYCIFNDNTMDIYKYNPPDRNRNSKKKIFQKLKSYTTKSDILFVRGYRNMLLVSMSNEFDVYIIDRGAIAERLNMIQPQSEILGGGLDGDQILIFTRAHFRKYRVQGSQLKLCQQSAFQIKIQDVKFIDVLKGENDIYFFVFSERKKVQFSTQSDLRLTETQDSDIKQIQRQGEAFHIIQLTRIDAIQYKCEHFDIAKIPEQGMFDLSKIFYLGNKTFLLSLHEQIVVIRKQYSRYIIVDNICVTSNRLTEESKTGQLVLIDKTNIIYNENERIYVYNMFYNRDQDKLKLEPVDDFKGVDEAQIILYDGILLTPKNTTIQVLFYFNVKKVRRPGRTKSTGPDPMDYSQKQDEKSKLKFSVYGIVQLKPIIKLVELLQAKRPAQQILQFRSRFQIQPLQYYKSQWSVSEKSLNDIVTHLLQINDQGFIQRQLGQVLRKETHTLGFLMKIEQKQIVRLRTALTAKLENQAAEELVVEAIQRLLQAKMFEKKLKYQNQFEAYKEVDFIDIKKLRETSLREEIKLLSCKGFERRLKRFLNQFKFLAIANFEDIFNFLMANKDDNDIQLFFLNFGFILPQAIESSIVSCFVRAGEQIRKRAMNDIDECTLWDDLDTNKQLLDQLAITLIGEKALPPTAVAERPQTIEAFLHDIYPKPTNHNSQLIFRLRGILQEFKQSEWFREGAFKKHCMLRIDEQQLKKQFDQLKSHRVYDILFKFLYERIKNPALLQAIIDGLVADGRIPPSYRANVNIRVGVYQLLQNIGANHMKDIQLSDFIIYSEPDYFNFLVKLSPHIKLASNENLIMTVIKKVYLQKVHEKGFFEERFNVYLMSNIINIETLGILLKECERLKNDFQSQNQPLLGLLVKSVARNLTICNNVDTKQILGILYNIDLVDPHLEMCAKIVQGFFFFEFYISLGLNYTYEEFIELTKVSENNKFFAQIIGKYCKNLAESTTFKYNEEIEGRTISKVVNFARPIDFFNVLKYIVQEVGFDIQINKLVEMFLLRMFLQERYVEVKQMLEELFNYIQDEDPKTFMENLVLKHVDNTYNSGDSMQKVYKHIKGALDLIDPQTISIKQKRAFIQLSLEISKLQYGILSKFDITNELKNKPMVFLIHLLVCLDTEAFQKVPNQQIQRAFQIIYEKMTEATNQNINFKASAKQSIQFQQFEIQRGYHYLRHGIIKLAIQICQQFSGQEELYYHDLIYAIVCAICQSNKYTEVDQACMILVQYIMLNPEVDVSKNKPAVTECLHELLGLDHQKQIEYMKSLEKKMGKKTQIHSIVKLPSLMDLMVKGLAEHVLGFKVEGHSNVAYYNTFMHLLKHNPIEAFYFMMKNPQMSINNIMHTIQQNADSSKFQREFIAKYFTLAIYIRSLSEVVQSFYPTYTFFQYKQNHLADDKTRRDINILASKLSLKEIVNPSAPKISDILMKYYSMYMEELGLNAYIDLTAVDLQVELDTQYQNQKQRKIDKNQLRLRQQLLQTQAKFNALTSSLQNRPLILQSRAPEVSITPLPDISRLNMKSPDLPSKTYEKYEDLKNRQMQVLKKMEDTSNQQAQAETKLEVDRLIEKYQLQRQQRLKKASREPSEVESVKSLRRDQLEAFDPLTPTPKRPQPTVRFQQRYIREQQKAEKPYDESKKLTAIASLGRLPPDQNKIYISDGESVASREINFIKRKMDDNLLKMTTGVTAKTLEDFKGYLAKAGQKDLLTYLSKVELTKKKLTLAEQFVKKMYEQCKSFSNFLKTLELIIVNFEDFNHLYEIKSIKIASHAIRLDSKIDPKKLFDIRFFQQPIPDMDEKQFYPVAFKRLQAYICRIIDDSNVHSLSKMILYGLGMQKQFEYKVYILYLSTKLDEFLSRTIDQKQLITLVEKLKSVYARLNRDIRKELIQELIQQKSVVNRAKVNQLTQKLQESINRTRKVNTSMVAPEDMELLEVMKML